MFFKSLVASSVRSAFLILAVFILGMSSFAATYVVTNPQDGGSPAPAGSLRYAIEQAEANPGPDVIYFDLIGPCPCEISIFPGLTISTALTIDGASRVSIRAGSLTTLFTVQSSGILTLRNLDVFANVSPSRTAVSNSGSVTIENSTIRRFFGAGIRNSSQMSILGSTITGNNNRDFTIAPIGGGIHNTGTLTVVNSTVSGNESIGHGGGIFNTGTLAVRNSTIAGNRSNIPNGSNDTDEFEDGGGIYAGGSETLQNTIVVGNTLSLGSGEPNVADDINGGVIDSYSNVLVGNPGTAGQMVHGVNGSIIGSSNGTQLLPMSEVIAPLANNGGPTQTHAFVAESPAINAGNTSLAVGADGTTPLATDQRGPGFPRIVGSSVDIGAWEGEPNVAPEILNFAANGPVNEGQTVTVTGTIADGNSADQFGGSIDWGDGAGPQQINIGLSVGAFELTHTYVDDGVYVIDISINDIGFFACASTQVTVNNSAPAAANLAMNPSPVIIDKLATLSFDKLDPGVNDTLSDIEVDWGDGSVQHPAANPNNSSFAFTHTYSTTGNFTIKVKLVDDDGGSSTKQLSASVVLPPPPAAPTLFRVDSVSIDKMTLAWTDNSNNEDGFAIESCRNNGCSVFREIGRVGSNVTSFTDVSLIANTQYYYRVRAFNGGGFSAYSNKAAGKTLRK